MGLKNRSRLLAGTLAMAVATTPTALLAQEHPGSEEDAQTPNASPAPSKPAPSKAAIAEARTRYDRGTKLYSEGDLKLALIEFQRAYELVPSYKVLYNIAQVSAQVGNYAAALKAFERYLAEGGDRIPQERREAVSRELESLRIRTAHISVTTNVAGAELTIDGVVVGATPLTDRILVDAGQHTVSARKSGYRSASRSLTLAGTDDVQVKLELEPEPVAAPVAPPVQTHPGGDRQRPEEETSRPSYLWIGWAVTGALAAGAIGAGIATLSTSKELDSQKTGRTTREALDEKQDELHMRAILTDVLGGAAVVVGGVTLYVTLSGGSASAGPKRTGSAPVRLGLSGRGVTLRGGF